MNTIRLLRNTKKAALILALLLLIFPFGSLLGCSLGIREVSRDGFYFDTYITLTLYDCDNSEAILDGAFGLCRRYDRLFDRTTSGSDVARINSAHGQPVEIDEATAKLIRLGLEYSELSGGVFDITCGAVTSLWDFSTEQPALPDSAALAQAVGTVDWTAVSMSDTTVSVPNGVSLELGGIAKGYIADRLADYLREQNVSNALIDLGGNILTLGNKKGSGYHVGIRSPFDPDGYSCIVNVSGKSVVTAGSYERGFELNGKYYHHILELETGMPADTGIVGATIISDCSAEGDALSTICFLMGKNAALSLLESIPDTEGILILSDGEMVCSSGAGDYITGAARS